MSKQYLCHLTHLTYPLKEQASSIAISMARDIANRVLQKSFGATNQRTFGKMKYYLQQNAVSCGVLTCYYVYQLDRVSLFLGFFLI